MAVNTQSELKVGDIVTHTGKRGFWDVKKAWKGIGLVMSPLYRKDDRKYVHDVWFDKIGQIQQIGAKALERINDDDVESTTRTHIRTA